MEHRIYGICESMETNEKSVRDNAPKTGVTTPSFSGTQCLQCAGTTSKSDGKDGKGCRIVITGDISVKGGNT